jgi:hypothetical protein
MKFRKTATAFLMALMMVLSLGTYAAPKGNEVIPSSVPSELPSNAETQRMINRLEEIKAMDLEHMPRSEKRKYAKEVKQIQKKMNAVGGGVYISAGALLIIIVLLILLL